jgi:hypothetical protein
VRIAEILKERSGRESRNSKQTFDNVFTSDALRTTVATHWEGATDAEGTTVDSLRIPENSRNTAKDMLK